MGGKREERMSFFEFFFFFFLRKRLFFSLFASLFFFSSSTYPKLYSPASLPLGRLGGADHPPLRVVQLSRLGQLPLPPDGGVDAPQVRERRGKRQPVEDLRHSRPHVGGALRAPVARRDRVPQPSRDRVLVDEADTLTSLPRSTARCTAARASLTSLRNSWRKRPASKGPPRSRRLCA